jgi:hypothetical protein
VVPTDCDGVMVIDRGRSYDAHMFDHVAQQKCLTHILRSISDIWEAKRGRARNFGEQLKGLLQDYVPPFAGGSHVRCKRQRDS